MGLQRISNAFQGRADVGGLFVNTIDQGPIAGAGGVLAYTSMYTNGTAVIAQPSLQTIGRKWKLLSVAFRALLTADRFFSPYGKLGKVYSGVDISGALNPTGPLTASAGSIPPWQNLPSDSSLISALWDPAVNSLPPDISSLSIQQTGLQAVSLIELPTPLPIHDTPISVGIWVEKSLLGCPNARAQFSALAGISVSNATYTLNFDDGE